MKTEITKGVQIYRPPLHWQLVRFLIAGSKDQAFLNRAWIPWLLKLVPTIVRRHLTLQLLAVSPHYFVYQWSSKYPPGLPRAEVLKREYERNKSSRKEICDKLLRQYLCQNMTVLDFGCGPGWLAREVSAYVSHVIAADVSAGTIACAKVLNPASNVTYVINRGLDLRNIGDHTIDLVYSFAVFQHIVKEQSFAFFKEFARILKPGGMGVCHIAIEEPSDYEKPVYPSWIMWYVKRIKLRMGYLPADEIEHLLKEAGFTEINITPIATLADIQDEIGSQHLVTFKLKTPADAHIDG